MIPSVLLGASFEAQIALLFSQSYSHTFFLIYDFFQNYLRKIVFRNVSLSNLENVLQRNLRNTEPEMHL